MNKRNAFTLIELLVVIIIVSILAAVSIPIIKGNVKRAILTEAVAGLGTIRTAERMHLIEYSRYVSVWDLNNIKWRTSEPYGTGSLDGTYFSQEAYVVMWFMGGDGKWGFWAYCGNDPVGGLINQSPKALYITSLFGSDIWWILMFDDGEIWTHNIPGSGYREV